MMKRLELNDFLNYKYLSMPIASPLKTKVAFIVSNCDAANNDYQSYIYVYEKMSGKVRKISNNGTEKSFCWLDDKTLIFTTRNEKDIQKHENANEEWTCWDLYDFDADNIRAYMKFPSKVTKTYHVKGNLFALVADYHIGMGNPLENGDEKCRKMLTELKERNESYLVADELPFRRDGLGYRNDIRSRLLLYNAEDNTAKFLTDEYSNIEFINISDGRIIFSAKTFTKDEPKRFDLSGVCVYDSRTDTVHEYVNEVDYRVRYCGFMGKLPVFAGSDGKRYGYQENPYFFYINEEEGKEHVFATNERSAQNSVGTDSRYGGGEYMATDENYIYYVGTDGGNANIKKVGLNGKVAPITDFVGSVDYITILDDEIIFVGMLENRLQELYSCKDGKYTRLTGFNDWVNNERTLSVPENLKYENDGIHLEGFIIKPINFDESKKYPGILYIHGGHKLSFGSVFFHEMQLWANEGYFIFYANPRGSDGYDNIFADIIGKYGFDDYSDLMKFCDVVLEKYPQIDEKRLGVGGGSYGGYMTNWIIGHTDKFKCAVSQRSIANFVSMFGTSDTSYRFPVWQFETSPWMDIKRYWKHSPLAYADKVKTPTLFIHSENDYRCPISEGIQMFSALKYHGIPARLCMFKNECHDLSRSGKPKNRVNRLTEITDWWNKFLK